jgi:hypothetical protein
MMSHSGARVHRFATSFTANTQKVEPLRDAGVVLMSWDAPRGKAFLADV